jgi:hypothetical protein
MKGLCLIIWMLLTLLLTFSVVGMLLFIGTTTHFERGKPDIVKSSWMEIGVKLLDAVIKGA